LSDADYLLASLPSACRLASPLNEAGDYSPAAKVEEKSDNNTSNTTVFTFSRKDG